MPATTTKPTARQRIAAAAAEHGWTKWEPKRPTLEEKFFIDEFRLGRRYVRVYFSSLERVIDASHRDAAGRDRRVLGTGKADQVIAVIAASPARQPRAA